MDDDTLDQNRERGANHREIVKRRQRAATQAVAEIGPPPITKQQRAKGTRLRNKCRNDLELFNTLIFPKSTGKKPFGKVQKDSIRHDESIIRHGGRLCKAEPRSFGKSSRTRNAALWAVCYGYRRMMPVFCASLRRTKETIDYWQGELRNNELLFFMFPELIWPLRALEGKHQRCDSQTYNGIPTCTEWTSDRVVFPSIDGVVGAGSALFAMPLVSCRGVTHTTPQGEVLRPDLILFDDVQTDKDANNSRTITNLEELIEHSAMMGGGFPAGGLDDASAPRGDHGA